MQKMTFRQRWHEFFQGRREIAHYYGGPHGKRRMREDAQYEHYMLVTQYELEAPHITRVGIELLILINVILFNLETFLYLMTGWMNRSWKLEIQRAEMEAVDYQLLRSAY